MEGHLVMSKKERGRLEWLPRVKSKDLTLAKAAQQMGLCYRQAERVMKRYMAEQDAGLVHRARGRPSPRAYPQAIRERALGLYEEHYADFGPTLGAEYLASQHDLHVGRGDPASVAGQGGEVGGALVGSQAPNQAQAQRVLWGDGATGRQRAWLV